jgi:hypothetical protein
VKETNLKQQETQLNKAIARATRDCKEAEAAQLMAKLLPVKQELLATKSTLQILQQREARAGQDAMRRMRGSVTDWRCATEGMEDVCNDATEWDADAGPHLEHVLPDDTMLCARVRAELQAIRNREEDEHDKQARVTPDTCVGLMSMLPAEYLRARKAYCALRGHKAGCQCQTDIAIVEAVLAADKPYNMRGLMKEVGVNSNVVSVPHFQQRLTALPLWTYKVPLSQECIVAQYIVMAKEEGLDYKQHSRLLAKMGPMLRAGVNSTTADKALIPKADIKAFKMMCSTKQDGRILEAALLHRLSNKQIQKNYGLKWQSVREETKNALAIVKSMMKVTDNLLNKDNFKGNEAEMVAMLEREFGVNDDHLAKVKDRVMSVLEAAWEPDELDGLLDAEVSGFLIDLYSPAA